MSERKKDKVNTREFVRKRVCDREKEGHKERERKR